MNNIMLYNQQFMLSVPMIGILIAIILFIGIVATVILRKHNKGIVRTELKTSNKFPFKVETLIDILGGKDNIKDAVGSYSKIKFTLVDTKVIKTEELKKISSGMIQSSTGATIIFGNISKPLAEEVSNMIN